MDLSSNMDFPWIPSSASTVYFPTSPESVILYPSSEEISNPYDLDFSDVDLELSDPLSSFPDDLDLLEPVDPFNLPVFHEILVDQYFDFELPWFIQVLEEAD